MPPANILSPHSAPSGIDKLAVLTTYNDFPQEAVAYCGVLIPLQHLIIVYSSYFNFCTISS
ncbi:hypothetical protein BKA82DRAFT_33000 [Pisolithus tinctorius]|uniref:Uncharacterized protein n=1 Tax=Pisolithus tinctorius Marx 270 TaxID=870435 RepID=A0A0C3NN91_PISTI|nr:hypothetical protein BKA82DRAFT_33000 [Pisolithus tinctorius]KIN96778.1 hypothetical protein M404DRAFT_33000 [Pisolithus tinctorius Marx 270]